ncbi:MAG TPA: cytochrome c biogenesis protein DipZ, partial [Solirubrobacteraceae bacterium]
MAVLVVVALLAGAGTALSPCVLPVLPALLSATGVGGRRRPFGVVLGLAITFTVSVALLARAVEGVGLGDGTLRAIAIVVVAGFGLALLLPSVAARLEAPLAGLSRLGPRGRGDGFWSGVGVGAALGFVYTPCTGPILGAVVSIGATTGTTLRTLAVAVAYAAGAAAVLLALALGGRRLLDVARRAVGGLTVQRALGAVLLVTAAAMAANLDVRVEQSLARHVPNANLTSALERSSGIDRRLAGLRPRSRFARATQGSAQAGLPRYGPAPDFAGTQRWFNTPGARPLTLARLRGRVVLVDFWTYTCINCLRTLPYLEAWDAAYRKAGLVILGVHSPEFAFEHVPGNVRNAVRELGVRYPVALDNHFDTWDAFSNQYWPAKYFIDRRGHIRFIHFGEGDYDKSEQVIRKLLAENGEAPPMLAHEPMGGEEASQAPVTP